MGETLSLSRPSFNRSVHIESRESHLSGDCGSILVREAIERTGLIDGLSARLLDPRDPRRVTHPLSELVRDALIMTAQGWGDQSDATHLREEPLFALTGSDRRGQAAAERTLASQSSFSRLLSMLSTPANHKALQAATIELAGRRLRAENRGYKRSTLTIDIDGVPLRAHGQQSGTAYSGHTHQRQHYPLLASCAETGDHLGALLRTGAAGPAELAATWIPQLVREAREHLSDHIRVRIDAGFADGQTLNALDAEGIEFIARLPSNRKLERLFEPHRCRGPGRPSSEPREWLVEATHQASTWAAEHRVVIVVQEHPEELFRRCFFLVTNMPEHRASGEKVAGRVRFHARCIQIDVERRAAAYWNRLMGRLAKLQPLPG